MLKKIEIMIMKIKSYNVLQKSLVSQKYKKCPPGKYAMLLYLAISKRWISLRWISLRWISKRWISLRWIYKMFDF